MDASITKQKLDVTTVSRMVSECLTEQVAAVRELNDGFFNTAFLVELAGGEKVVLKVAPARHIPVMKQEEDIMQAEVAAIRLVREQTSLPVPTVIAHVEQSRYIDSPFFIMDYMDGVPLDKVLADLTSEEQTRVYRQLGRYMQELHNMHGDGFGYVLNNGCGYATWSQAFISIIDNVLDDARRQNVALPMDPSEIHRRVVSYAPVLDMVTRPSLLHRDLWMGNIFVRRDSLEITGITDWERALYGDVLMEFVFGFIEGPSSFEGKVGFNEGYGRTGNLTDQEQIRVHLYYLYFALLILVEGYYRGYRTIEQDEHITTALLATMRNLVI